MTTSTALSPILSVDAARTFLAVGGEMSSKKLQRIIYLAHENHIRETDKPMIQGDPVEAWGRGLCSRICTASSGTRTRDGSFPRICPMEGSSLAKTPENTSHRSARSSRTLRESVCPAWRAGEDRLGAWPGEPSAGQGSPSGCSLRPARRSR